MMEQDTNREYLKKLLDFLEKRILSIPENQWFNRNLYKILSPASDAKISDIHEQCIESILTSQAEDFYKDFVLEDIRPQLIIDFIKMEHWRRRNNIQEFCMALYQQIEAITNHIGRNESLNLIWRNIRNAGFFVDMKAKDICIRWAGTKEKPNPTIEKSIVYKQENYGKELCEFVAMDKFKAILFMIVYKTYVDGNNKALFNEDFNTCYDIYLTRNLNHRGNIIEDHKVDRIAYILNNPTYTMCSLLGYYAKFVSGINNNYTTTELKGLEEFAQTYCKLNNS